MQDSLQNAEFRANKKENALIQCLNETAELSIGLPHPVVSVLPPCSGDLGKAPGECEGPQVGGD